MSRVGSFPVPVPKGVEFTLGADAIPVKGELGTLTQRLMNQIRIKPEGDQLML